MSILYGLGLCSAPGCVEPGRTIRVGSSAKRRSAERVTHALRQWMTDCPPSKPKAAEVPVQPAPELEAPKSSPPPVVAVEPDQAHSIRMEGSPNDMKPEPANEPGSRAEAVPPPPPAVPDSLPLAANHYELLQISPNADLDTIHRVYRFMAARFHPDNPTTGNQERFLRLKQAFEVLADPARRAAYDQASQLWEMRPLPVFGDKAFLDGLEGEMNRRFGILSLLYYRRRISGSKPGLSLLELENRMAFPREHLEFALWYLKGKGYVAVSDHSSDYALTPLGVDFVEQHSSSNRVVRQLLAEDHSTMLLESGDSPAATGFRKPSRLKNGSAQRPRFHRSRRLTTFKTRTAGGEAACA